MHTKCTRVCCNPHEHWFFCPIHRGGNRQAARWRHNGSGSRNRGSSAHAGGSGRLGAGDEYRRKPAIIRLTCLRWMHAADRFWQALKCTNARLEKRCRRVGFRFQVVSQGLGSAVQALGADLVRLRSCLNVRPDTVVATVFNM